jgi:hypothetical protein
MGLSDRARRRRVLSLAAVALLLSMLAIGPRGALALIQQIGDSPSPATGHAQVIAQGVSALPDGSGVWRVSQPTAASLDTGEPTNYGLGFTVATDGGVLVNDYTTGLQQRLSNGEAAFSESGAYQQHVALSGADTSYLRISLVSGNGADGGENVSYASDAFTSVDGLRDIDLLRDVLGEGESTTVNAGTAPSLVYVTAGEVIVDDGRDTTTLREGEGMTVDGEFDVESNVEQSVVLAAVIGNDVPAPPRISGTVTLDVHACPADVTKEQLQDAAAEGSSTPFETCTALADPAKAGLKIDLKPANDDALPLSAAGLTDDDGVVTWGPLPFGDYTLGDITAYPETYGDFVMSDGNLNLDDHSGIALSRDNPDATRVIYLLQAPRAAGSIAITYYVCAVSSFDDFNRDDCDPFAGGIGTDLAINGADSPTTLDDAEQTDTASYIWNDLPVAESEDPQGSEQGFYLLGFEQGDTDPSPRVVVDGADYIEAAGGYAVKLTPEHPNAEVSYYLVNVLGETQGNIYIVGMVCPDANAELADCDANGSAQLPAVTIPAASGSSVDQDSATVSGDAYIWTDLGLDDTYTIAAGNIVAPDGYEVRTIVHYQTGDSGDSLDATLTEDSPVADFIAYLDPIGDDSDGGDEGTPVDTDSDGLTDADEATYGTDASSPDTDTDCFSDGGEVEAGTDPLDAASFPDGDCDIR